MNSKASQIYFKNLSIKLITLSEKNKIGIITNKEIDELITLSHKVDVIMHGNMARPREYYTNVLQEKIDCIVLKTKNFVKDCCNLLINKIN